MESLNPGDVVDQSIKGWKKSLSNKKNEITCIRKLFIIMANFIDYMAKKYNELRDIVENISVSNILIW